LGYVGEINPDELETHKGYVNGDSIGRSGIEAAYEKQLRGLPRLDTYQVDPTGMPVGDPVKSRQGRVGDDVRLSLNIDVQQVAEAALAEGMVKARQRQNKDVAKERYENFKAPAGSVVVLDAQTGGVVAMASNPTYSPSKFVGGITNDDWARFNDKAYNFPLLNRVTQGRYAPGSTFKLVTSIAATVDGVRSPVQWVEDNGSIDIGGDKRSFHNAGNKAHGNVDLQKALTVSSDVYFYGLGYDFWKVWDAGDHRRGDGIQHTAKDLGFGAKTGIEVSESRGLVPDAAWKAKVVKEFYPNDKKKQDDNRPWYPGNNVNLAVGQGDLLVTPLQLADAYATFANGGTLVTPHLAESIEDPNAHDKVVRRIAPKPARKLAFDPTMYQRMAAGFAGAVSDPEGTAYAAFQGFPFDQVPVAGKTGTAQVQAVHSDTSLFAAYFTANNHQYVIVTTIEQAGFGSEVAAPVSRRVIEKVAGLPLTPINIAKDTTTDVGD
jgi:penicillin-binding protein 2